MRVLIVGEGSGTTPVADGLRASGIEVESRADDEPPADVPQEIAAIASDLRELERALDGTGVDALLIASDSPAALAAVVVATKLGVPVASLLPTDATSGEGANVRVIHQLADATLAPDVGAIVGWVRDGYPART